MLKELILGKIVELFSLIGKALSYLAFWKLGRDSVQKKQLEKELEELVEAKKTRIDVVNMSDDEQREWLRKFRDR